MRRLHGTASHVTFCPSAAVNEPHRARASPAAEEAHGLWVLSPSYWSRPKPRFGRSRAALVRGIACGGCAARLPPDHALPPYGSIAGPKGG